MKILLSTLLLLTTSSPTFAICDCFESLSHRKEFRRSRAVFIGEVVRIDTSNETREDLPDELKDELGDLITLRVIKAWKGSKTEQVIWTHATHELCSKWKFKVGEKYLIYAHKIKKVLVCGEYCTRTRPLETKDRKQIKELKKLDSSWFRLRGNIPIL